MPNRKGKSRTVVYRQRIKPNEKLHKYQPMDMISIINDKIFHNHPAKKKKYWLPYIEFDIDGCIDGCGVSNDL